MRRRPMLTVIVLSNALLVTSIAGSGCSEREPRHTSSDTASPSGALDALRGHPALAAKLADARVPERSGSEFVVRGRRARASAPQSGAGAVRLKRHDDPDAWLEITPLSRDDVTATSASRSAEPSPSGSTTARRGTGCRWKTASS